MNKSFIIHIDSLAVLDEMTFEQKGILFDAIYKYQIGEVVELDFAMKMAFTPFKNQFIRDGEKYESICERNKYNGNKGGRPKANPNEPKKPSGLIGNPKNPNEPYNDSKSKNESKNDNDNETESKEEFTHPLKNSNLFREPKIPTLDEVARVFRNNGGTDEMAQTFFEKNNSVGWFLKGSPITNFTNLVPSFITNWKQNESHKRNNGEAKLGTSAARIKALKEW